MILNPIYVNAIINAESTSLGLHIVISTIVDLEV